MTFYQEVLGFQLENIWSLQEEIIAFVTLDNTRIELIQPVEPPIASLSTHLAFEVNDLNEWMPRMIETGLVVEGPVLLPNGWRHVFFYGPDQELLEFLEVGSST